MQLLHFLFLVLLFGPILISIWGYFKGRSLKPDTVEGQNKKWRVFPMIVNSAVLYALAYNIIYFIQELFLALGKQWIGLTAYLYHNNHNWEGTDPRDDLMQGLGALAIFILGLILIPFFLKMRNSKNWITLFFLWLIHHGLIQSLPQLSSVPMDRGSDTGQAITYLQLGTTAEFLLCYASIIAIIGLSFFFSKWFLCFTPQGIDLNHPFARFKSIFFIVVLPAILGTIIIFPYKIFPFDRFYMAVMLLIVCVPSIFAFSWMIKNTRQLGSEANDRILITPIILSIVLLLFFQLVLAPGVRFG